MSLDVYLTAIRPTQVYDANITNSLVKMAREAEIYQALWHPEEIGITHAKQLIEPLRIGLERLMANPPSPPRFQKLKPNDWGNYKRLITFIKHYLRACEEDPDAEVAVSR